jgi:two-component system cell cycle sensor histidine kinase/response regulator CckA
MTLNAEPSYTDLEQRIKTLESGDHLCSICKTEEENRALLTPFLKGGLEQGEKVLFFLHSYSTDEIVSYLGSKGITVDSYLNKGQFRVLSAEEVYLKGGTFEPDAVISLLRTETDRALQEGYSALRVTGDMGWASDNSIDPVRLIEYETKINQFFTGSKCMALCQYNRKRYEPSLLFSVLTTHPIAVVGAEIFDNVLYQPVTDFADSGIRTSTLDIWLDNIVEHRKADKELKKSFDDMARLAQEHTAKLHKAIELLKQENEKRKQIEKALRESEAEYQDLYDNAPDMFLSVDAKTGRITQCNQTLLNTLGYNKEEIIGQRVSDLYHPSSEQERRRIVRMFLERGEVDNAEIKVLRKDKSTLDVILKVSSIRDNNGRVIFSRSVWRDITERKKIEARLHQAQKMEFLGTLAGGVAHDFNNLLMAIQGRTSLMLMDTDTSNPKYKYLKEIEYAVSNGAELTSGLLGFARGGKYDVKPTDFNELIKRQSQMFGHTKKEITIHEKYERDLWTVEVDRGQMEQVLLNLYVNASHAMPDGGDLYIQTENVTIDSNYAKPFKVEPGKYIKISVTDTGIGMNEETKQKIFEPFFTTKEMGRGTGLGLASVYGIVKNHGGFISVYSEEEQGSTFTIYLPTTEKVPQKEEELSQELLKGTETILLVDDEKIVISVGQDMLQSLGYDVLLARSGNEAVALYQVNKEKIDMVILDMIMPDMSGGTTYDKLKEINPEIKVLLSSGYSLNGLATKILERGCDDFIQKPFKLDALSHKIRSILDSKDE